MNSQQFQSLITPAVDGRLEGEDRLEFDLHLEECHVCRSYFVAEQSVKKRIQNMVPRQSAPPDLRKQILQRIHDEAHAEQTKQPWRKRILAIGSVPGVKPVAMVSFAAVAVFMLVTYETSGRVDSSTDRNLVERSFVSYHALQSGLIGPEIVSDNPVKVQGFLSRRTEREVDVPLLHDFVLVGGLTSSFRGIRVAQILYRRGSMVLRVTQVPLNAVLRNNSLSLPLNVRNELLHSGWYSDSYANGDAVVLWTRGATLCTAIAQMQCSELQAVMSGTDDSAGAVTPW